MAREFGTGKAIILSISVLLAAVAGYFVFHSVNSRIGNAPSATLTPQRPGAALAAAAGRESFTQTAVATQPSASVSPDGVGADTVPLGEFPDQLRRREIQTAENMLAQRQQLLSRVDDPGTRAMIVKSIKDHERDIAAHRQELARTSDDLKAGYILMGIGCEYSWMYEKTPAEAPQRLDYLTQAIEAHHEGVTRGNNAIAAFYLAMDLESYVRDGFPPLSLDEAPVNAERVLVYYLKSADLLAEFELHRAAPKDEPHQPWLVDGIVRGSADALRELGRADDIPRVLNDLVTKYQGSVLGRQLAESVANWSANARAQNQGDAG